MLKNYNSFKDMSKSYTKMGESLSLCLKASKHSSIERRVIRSLLCKNFTTRQISELMNTYEFKLATGRTRITAKSDYESLLNEGCLTSNSHKFSKLNESDIKYAVNYILNELNVTPLSYGHKTVPIGNGNQVILPKLQRKRVREDIIRDYKNLCVTNARKPISRTQMYNILNAVTTTDQVSISAIDYVTSSLVNETTETLQFIIEKLVPLTHAKKASDIVQSTAHFLKHEYGQHIMKENDNICYHGLSYSLAKNNIVPKLNTSCMQCKFPFFCVSYLQTLLKNYRNVSSTDEQLSDAIQVIKDITSTKHKLYMAHIARCRCQSKAIADIDKQLQTECSASQSHHRNTSITALLIIDFKMKFEAKSSRESTIEHFGKRGIGWHGAAIIFYLNEPSESEEDGNDGYVPKKYIVYIDQIMEESNKQDGMTVASLLEAILVTISDQLPFIKNIILQSDNANQYQNHLLVVVLHALNIKMKRTGTYIKEFVHTETQDGKTLLDGHFANANRHLVIFMKTWRKNKITRIKTPAGLAFSLSHKGGCKNGVVQLVQVDRSKLDLIAKKIEPMSVKLKQYFHRVNHIYYESPQDTDEMNTIDDIDNMKFRFQVQAHSNVNTKVTFNVDMKLCTLSAARDDEETIIEEDIEPDGNESISDNNAAMQSAGTDETVNNDATKTPTTNLKDFEYIAIDEGTQRNFRTILDFENEGDHESDDEYEEESQSDDDSDDNEIDADVSNISVYQEPVENIYKPSSFLTNTKIIKHLTLGALKKNKSKKKKQMEERVNEDEPFDSIGIAVLHAKETVSTSDYFFDSNTNDPLYELATNHPIDESDIFQPGWAQRQGNSELYGATYIEDFKDDLLQMFEKGQNNSGAKMNPGKMREQLVQKYPLKFAIPGETEIKMFIGAQIQKGKYKRKTTSSTTAVASRRNTNKDAWVVLLENIVKADPARQPRHIVDLYLSMIGEDKNNWPEHIPITNDANNEIDKAKIKAKISQIKTKLQKFNKRSILTM